MRTTAKDAKDRQDYLISTLRPFASFAVVLVLLLHIAAAQDAATWLERGHAAARANRHAEAIAAYERAGQLDARLARELAGRLGRQYLWNDQPARAVPLLAQSLADYPRDCDLRFDYALALSWANRLGAARDAYREAERACPERRVQARLGEARVLRWMDRNRPAEKIYRELQDSGQDTRDALAGRGFIALAQDRNREAARIFDGLLRDGSWDASLIEAQAVAEYRLGRPARALQEVAEAEQAGVRDVRLTRLREDIARSDNLALSPSFNFFHDADGTRYWSTEFSTALGPDLHSRLEMFAGASQLESFGQQVDGRWGGLRGERRFSPTLALRGEGRIASFGEVSFRPFTGELDAVITPGDRTRVDLSVARIIIHDNLASLEHRLTGIFASAGLDRRLTSNDTVSVSIDATRWSEGNRRMRYRAAFSHRFEGTPRLRLSWPLLYMTYDRGFPFPLFSPRTYVETAPGADLDLKRARFWSLRLHAQIGAQREAGAAWQAITILRGELERELVRHWGFRLGGGWSNSNLASPTGFRRASLYSTVQYRF